MEATGYKSACLTNESLSQAHRIYAITIADASEGEKYTYCLLSPTDRFFQRT